MERTYRSCASARFAAICLGLSALSAPAFAQDPPPPTQLTERANVEAPSEDVTNFAVSAGANVATGNTRSWNLAAGTAFRLVRGRHATAFDWAFNYGRAAPAGDTTTPLVDTVRNSNTKLRYDFYLTRMDALFVAAAHRWDTFAGLDTRLQLQAGYLRNFVREENHRAWGEIGYDMTYDNFTEIQMSTGEDTQIVHAARIYLGYENNLNEYVKFLTGVETLLNFQQIEDLRINFDAALRSTIAGRLQVELKFKLLFDNVPAERADGTSFEKLDTLTTVSLIYTFL
ncbi:MAG: DUF481 domain-containing protein [Myxococcales bacterium]|nr:DUF481 domain-containing protein [Myxococcales bacterium]